MQAFPNCYCVSLRQQKLQAPTDTFGHVGDLASQFDDFVEKDCVDRIQRFLDLEYRRTEFGLSPVCLRLDLLQLLDHL